MLTNLPKPSIWEDDECPDIGRLPRDRDTSVDADVIRGRDLGNPDDIRTIRIRCPEAVQ